MIEDFEVPEEQEAKAPEKDKPLILHEQTGLQIRKNKKNKFVVCRLHYTADPAKREPWWKEEAKLGLPEAKFRQEYELDYTAMFGEKVFPQIHQFPEKIIVKQPHPEIPDHLTLYAGLDWGIVNPTSFHVYAYLKNEDGEDTIFVVWEHYEPTKDLTELVRKIRDECPYWDRLRWIAADPQLWANDQLVGDQTTSKYFQLYKAGLTKLVPGPRKDAEARWIPIVHQHWAELGVRSPTFRIFDNCPNMIREFKNAIYVDMSDHEQRIRNWKERMVDKDNHAMDDCKYFMLLGPKPWSATQKQKQETHQRELWRRHAKRRTRLN